MIRKIILPVKVVVLDKITERPYVANRVYDAENTLIGSFIHKYYADQVAEALNTLGDVTTIIAEMQITYNQLKCVRELSVDKPS